jgi:hypothetical protein
MSQTSIFRGFPDTRLKSSDLAKGSLVTKRTPAALIAKEFFRQPFVYQIYKVGLFVFGELTGTTAVGASPRVVTFSNVVLPVNASIIIGANINGGAVDPTITASGGGLTWTTEATIGGTGATGSSAYIFSAFNLNAQTATITVTATGNSGGGSDGDMACTLWIFTGGRSSDVCGATDTYAATTDATDTGGLLEVNTTVAGSIICVTAVDWTAKAVVTPIIKNCGTVVFNQGYVVGGASTHYNFRSDNPKSLASGVNTRVILDVSTNGDWAMAMVEVLPAFAVQTGRNINQSVKRSNYY